jgi:hypothetical protein
MIDDDPDPGTDPLAGRDPHPRTQIDLWPLHDARRELLEEIVSQTGPGGTAAPSTRRFLLPIGVAAAIALVAGGAWLVVSDGDSAGDEDGRVVASSASADGTDGVTDDATDAATAPEATETPGAERIPADELRKGDVLAPGQCRDLQGGLVVADGGKRRLEWRVKKGTTVEKLRYVVLRRGAEGKDRWHVVVDAGKRWIALDQDCTVVAVERGPRPVRR